MDSKLKQALHRITYAFSAQSVSLILSIIMSLIVPKILGVEQYSYWQLFGFYICYVNLFHFGINDGVYLKLGGKEYEKIDHKLIGGEIKVACSMQLIIATLIIFVLSFFSFSDERMFVFFSVAIYMILFNMQCFIGYIFQAVNLIQYYSKAVMIDKASYIILLFFMIIFKVMDFRVYVLCYIFTCFLSLIYLIIIGKKMMFNTFPDFKELLKEVINDIKVGINLTLASVASTLVIGTSRFFVDYWWGIEIFGKLSFALSLTNFFLLFSRQIGLVLYPLFCKANEEIRMKVYGDLREVMCFVFPAVYLLYIPIKEVLGVWLPEYGESLMYLVFLLPLCAFDSEMQIVGNMYLKVLRKENILFKINAGIVILSFILTAFVVFYFNNIYAIIIVMVLVSVIRSIIASVVVENVMGIEKHIYPIFEIVLSVFYMIVSFYYTPLQAFFMILFVYLVYMITKRKKIEKLFYLLRNKI